VIHRPPEQSVAELVPQHLQDCRAFRINVSAEEDFDRIIHPPTPHDRTARAAVGFDGLLLRAEPVQGGLVDAEILLAEDLLHERRETFVEPDIAPVACR